MGLYLRGTFKWLFWRKLFLRSQDITSSKLRLDQDPIFFFYNWVKKLNLWKQWNRVKKKPQKYGGRGYRNRVKFSNPTADLTIIRTLQKYWDSWLLRISFISSKTPFFLKKLFLHSGLAALSSCSAAAKSSKIRASAKVCVVLADSENSVACAVSRAVWCFLKLHVNNR